MQRLFFTSDPAAALSEVLAEMAPEGRIFILADSNTATLCLPVIEAGLKSCEPEIIVVSEGDANKDLDSLAAVWSSLSGRGAT